jgi:membrane-associated phospholipid phosphatase
MTGNTGNTGNTGDTGNTGNAGVQGELGGGWFIQDRVDLPFVMELDPSNAPIRFKDRASTLAFGDHTWFAKWWGYLVLHDFVGTSWRATTDPVMNTAWGTISPASTTTELNLLVNAARDERPQAMGEILSQDVEFITDFMGLLTITPGSHPNTYRVLHAASLIGSYAVLYYKGYRGRPRPSQLRPALLPPIPVPGHASWPSGHATQAWLMMLSIEYVLTNVVTTGDFQAISSNLRTLAVRIARNREIAGLHYPSDSLHGRTLAQTIAPFLTGMTTGSWFYKASTAAKGEWS